MISVSRRSDPSQIGSCKLLTLKIYKILGQAEVVLVNEEQSAGSKEIEWNALPSIVSSGVYFYRLEAGSFTQTKKMLLLR